MQYHTEYLDLMKKDESLYLKMVNLLNPKVTIKRPTKSFRQWRRKAWWSMGRFKQRGWKEFHIISEKKRIKLNLN